MPIKESLSEYLAGDIIHLWKIFVTCLKWDFYAESNYIHILLLSLL